MKIKSLIFVILLNIAFILLQLKQGIHIHTLITGFFLGWLDRAAFDFLD